jgi:type II secretory pathway component HofQ
VGEGITATSAQNINQELDKVAALVAELRTYQHQMGLDPQQQTEVSRHVEALDEELRGSKPNTGIIAGLLRSIKNMAEGAAGNLVASAVISAISNVKL